MKKTKNKIKERSYRFDGRLLMCIFQKTVTPKETAFFPVIWA